MNNRRGMVLGIALLVASGAGVASDFGRDPTRPQPRPGSSASEPPAVPSLSMIHTRLGERRAFINGQWYHTGEWVNGYRVAAIDSRHVTLVRNSRQYEISVNSQGLDIRRH